MPNTIRPETLLLLEDIFTTRNWNSASNRAAVFARFAAMLANFPESEQQLILKLAMNFLWVRWENYPFYLELALSSIPADYFDVAQRIYVMPLKQTKKEDG